MGSVERRGKSWYARYRDPSGQSRAKTFARKLDAQRWLANMEVGVQQGNWVDPALGRTAYGRWSEGWLASQSHLKPSTRTRYGVAMRRQILPTWEGVPLRSITHVGVTVWLAELLKSGLSPASVRYAYRVFARSLGGAVCDKRIVSNPAEGIKLPRSAPKDKIFLNHDQVEALAQACGDFATLVRLLAYTGLRWGEAAGLRVRRVDLFRRRLVIAETASEHTGTVTFGTPKSHQQRHVPLPAFLVAELEAQINRKQPDGLVFTSPSGGPLRNGNFRRDVYNRAAASVGLMGLRIHDLRHTAASLAVAAGANVKAVQQMLGHASAAMTLDVYSGLFDDDLSTVAVRLDEAVAARRVYGMCTPEPEQEVDDDRESHPQGQNPRPGA